MGRIIAVANQKGGVGKTTTCVNTSAALAAAGKKVLLCDFDPQANASSGLGILRDPERQSVYSGLIEDVPARDLIVSTPYCDVLPSGIELAGAEIELVKISGREKRLKLALDQVRDEYDYIFIDCPPSLGLLTLNALTAVDSVLIPIQCEFYALEGVSQLVSTVDLVRKSLNPKLRIEGVILSMFDGRTNLSLQVVEEVKRYFGSKLYSTVIPRNVRLAEAPSYGLPITSYDPRSKGAKAYQAFADEFLSTEAKHG